jgi:hypothetical protein
MIIYILNVFGYMIGIYSIFRDKVLQWGLLKGRRKIGLVVARKLNSFTSEVHVTVCGRTLAILSP